MPGIVWILKHWWLLWLLFNYFIMIYFCGLTWSPAETQIIYVESLTSKIVFFFFKLNISSFHTRHLKPMQILFFIWSLIMVVVFHPLLSGSNAGARDSEGAFLICSFDLEMPPEVEKQTMEHVFQLVFLVVPSSNTSCRGNYLRQRDSYVLLLNMRR